MDEPNVQKQISIGSDSGMGSEDGVKNESKSNCIATTIHFCVISF